MAGTKNRVEPAVLYSRLTALIGIVSTTTELSATSSSEALASGSGGSEKRPASCADSETLRKHTRSKAQCHEKRDNCSKVLLSFKPNLPIRTYQEAYGRLPELSGFRSRGTSHVTSYAFPFPFQPFRMDACLMLLDHPLIVELILSVPSSLHFHYRLKRKISIILRGRR